MKPPLPLIPGSECSGLVEAIGQGLADLAVCDRVLADRIGGLLCGATVLPASVVRRIPDSMSLIDAAVFRASYAAAYYALVQRAKLEPGEIVLALGAGGAVGYAAVQVAKALGTREIASASNAAKRALAAADDADCMIDSHAADWRDQVKKANGGRGVDVVVDPLSGEATEPAFRSLAWSGRQAGAILSSQLLKAAPPSSRQSCSAQGGAALVGVDLRQFGIFEPKLAAANLGALLEFYQRGLLSHCIACTFPIEEFAAARNMIETGVAVGRVVVTIA